MKSIMLSIKPKWCELIAQGKKTVEVRKTKPKIDVPFKCYIYCTMGKLPKYIYNENLEKESIYAKHPDIINGKIIGEFVCKTMSKFDSIDYITPEKVSIGMASCLTEKEFVDYVGNNFAYGWHITDLVIYDKPKELYEFLNYNKYQVCKEKGCFSDDCWICPNNAIVTKPPQSYYYIDVEELGV